MNDTLSFQCFLRNYLGMIKILKKGSWNAVLNTNVCDPYNNAELTIKMNLGFKQVNPASCAVSGMYHDYGDKNERARKIIKWTHTEWSIWKTQFLRSAQKFWHGKFWLVNGFSMYEYEVKGVKYIPNIWCRFELTGTDVSSVGASGTHHNIEVVRLHKSESWFGSHSRLYDSLDTNAVQKGIDSKGKPIMQRAHIHEIGHLLGLDHVDVGKKHCPSSGDTNARPCYGVVDIDKNSVMGQGMQLFTKHANPWRRAIAELSGKGAAVSAVDWEPKMVRHYPRTPAEVAANATITSRPKR
jgi:hypothetical protein